MEQRISSFQLTVDCAAPAVLVRFWATALGYDVQPPPNGFGSWNEYWRSVGVPEAELDDERDSADSLVDSAGHGPRIWFQQVPEPKTVKNRLHLDLSVGGGRTVPLPTRRERVLAEEARLVAAGAQRLYILETEGLDHFGVTLAVRKATSSASTDSADRPVFVTRFRDLDESVGSYAVSTG